MHSADRKTRGIGARTQATGSGLFTRRYLRTVFTNGIYELRVGLEHLNYRILYFFHGRVAAVISHGLVKEDAVPQKEISKALERKRKFESDPQRHTHSEE
jgi:phage-related protein